MQHRCLFLNLDHITRMDRLYRRIHQPQRHPKNPILKGENPWETVWHPYTVPLSTIQRKTCSKCGT